MTSCDVTTWSELEEYFNVSGIEDYLIPLILDLVEMNAFINRLVHCEAD